jgi:hypothetical protein
MMKPQYIYITFSLSDDGIEGCNDFIPSLSNLLLLSPGGKGHIPMLLWAGWPSNARFYPIADTYKYDVMLLGKQSTHLCRPIITSTVMEAFGKRAHVG